MSRASTPAKVLRVAQKRVRERWTQGALSSYKGGKQHVCLVGSLTGGTPLTTQAQLDAYMFVQQALRNEGLPSAVQYNDTPGRTAAEIELVLKQAEQLALEATDTGR